jgi:hypothetical protein
MRACACDELLPDSSRLRTCIDDEYRPACLAEDVGGGYMRNMQNCVSYSITNGMKSPVSPMMRPGLRPSRIHRCPCFLVRTCEKSILAAVGITQASLMSEVIKTFDDHLLDLLLQKVTPHKWPAAMHTARESTPPHPIDEFCSLRCEVHPTNNALQLPNQPLRNIPERIDAIQGEDRQGRQSQALALCYLRKNQPCRLLMRVRRLFPPLVPGGID